MHVLEDFGLNLKNLYAITTDNASNMLKSTRMLSQISLEESERGDCDDDVPNLDCEKLLNDVCTEISENVQIIRCGAHTLQLAVNNVLDEYKSEFARIAKICVILRKPVFVKALRDNNLNQPLLHNETRWTSSYKTIEYVFQNFDQIRDLLETYLPDEVEHELPELENLYFALKPVNIMTLAIQRENLTFGDLYLALEKLYIELEHVDNTISEKLINKISNSIF